MSSQKLKLTYDQLYYIMEQTGISDLKKSVEYFAELMSKEGIDPKMMPQVVDKLIAKQRKRSK